MSGVLKLSVLLLVGLIIGCEGSIESDQAQRGSSTSSPTPDMRSPVSTSKPSSGDMGVDSGFVLGEEMGSMSGEDMANVVGEPRWVDPKFRENFLTPNVLSQSKLFECKDPDGLASPSSLRRLGAKEWVSGAGFSMNSDLKQSPLVTPNIYQYDSHSQGLGIDSVLLYLHLDVAPLAADKWSNKMWSRSSSRFQRRVVLREQPEVACFFEDQVATTCIDSFVRTFLEKGVYYRPVTDAEFSRVRDYAAKKLQEEAGPQDREATVQAITTLAWLSPGVLFRSQQGAGEVDEHGRKRLGAWELAQALSYAISYHGPEGAAVQGPGIQFLQRASKVGPTIPTTGPEGWYPELAEAARQGTIWDKAFIESFVRDNLVVKEPEGLGGSARPDLVLDVTYNQRAIRSRYRTSGRLKSFFEQWLGLDKPHVTFWDLPANTTALERDLRYTGTRTYNGFRSNGIINGHVDQRDKVSVNEQLMDTIGKVVHDEKDFLKSLLTTDRYYIGPHSARSGTFSRFYGFEQPPIDQSEQGWVTLPPKTRVGVLGHPAWLAAHSGNFDNSPSLVFRGKWVSENLLCWPVPPPPDGAAVGLKPEHAKLSARERINHATMPLDSDTPEERAYKQGKCAGCHGLLNSLGLPFEMYNHAGLIRVDDRGQEPSGQSTIKFTAGEGGSGLDDLSQLNGEVKTPQEFANLLANSSRVKRCFVRQTFRYFAGRPEQYADACTLQTMEQAYDKRGSFIDMLVALLTSDTFLYRYQPILKEAP